MESSRGDDRLAEALGALRPGPSIALAAELDERVAAGSPRRRGEAPIGRFGARPARLGERLRAIRPRRILLPVTATALSLIAVATIVVANRDVSSLPMDSGSGAATTQARPPRAAAAAPERGESEAEL